MAQPCLGVQNKHSGHEWQMERTCGMAGARALPPYSVDTAAQRGGTQRGAWLDLPGWGGVATGTHVSELDWLD